jgi:iron complex transport system substrate-binding protein
MRIASLLPSATEMVAALGLADQLVAVSHACDYPPDVVINVPILTRSAIPAGLSQPQVDAAVAERIRRGESLYLLDEELLEGLAPDVILTQELCTVCAVLAATVRDALCRLPHDPRVVSLEPTTIADILDTIRTIGEIAGVPQCAGHLIASLRQRLERVAEQTRRSATCPRVFAMEWMLPPFSAGHWVPEMVALAGGTELLGCVSAPSARLAWDAITTAQPECIILMPCGYTVETTQRELPELPAIPFPDVWWELPTVHNGNLFAVDATAYFSRPGPRVVEDVELLAALLHPEMYPAPAPRDAQQVQLIHTKS